MTRKANANYAVEVYALLRAFIEDHIDTLYEYINNHGECADIEHPMHQALLNFECEKFDRIKNEEFIHELFEFNEVIEEVEDEEEAYEAARKFASFIEANYIV